MLPIVSDCLNTLDVSFSITIDGWSNRNIKGFWMVTAHWVDTRTATLRSVLLTILDVQPGRGVRKRIGTALFEFLSLGASVLTKLLAVVSDNGSDAISAVNTLFQLTNTFIGYERLHRSSHIRCADHYVQVCVTAVLKLVKGTTAKLREALVKIRQSKVLRQAFRREA
jgi:hypothetical protein